MHWNVPARSFEFVLFLRRIVRAKLVCHVHGAGFEIWQNCIQHLDDGRHPANERQVHSLDLWPKRKSCVGNYQRVRMPNPAEQMQQVGIDDSLDDHVAPSV